MSTPIDIRAEWLCEPTQHSITKSRISLVHITLFGSSSISQESGFFNTRWEQNHMCTCNHLCHCRLWEGEIIISRGLGACLSVLRGLTWPMPGMEDAKTGAGRTGSKCQDVCSTYIQERTVVPLSTCYPQRLGQNIWVSESPDCPIQPVHPSHSHISISTHITYRHWQLPTQPPRRVCTSLSLYVHCSVAVYGCCILMRPLIRSLITDYNPTSHVWFRVAHQLTNCPAKMGSMPYVWPYSHLSDLEVQQKWKLWSHICVLLSST